MSVSLEGQRRASASGEVSSVVVFLHGYGADGADLLGLADPLAPHMPDTAFHAPNAPERCSGNPFGYQWFPIPWLDGSPQEAADASLDTSAVLLNDYLDRVLEEEKLTADRLILFGFSQGTMISLHVAPRRPEQVAGIAGFSGRLLHPERLASETVSRPPVLLVHGDADDVVPPSSSAEAAEALQAAEFKVYGHISKGTAHGIAPDGLSVALSFMLQCLDPT